MFVLVTKRIFGNLLANNHTWHFIIYLNKTALFKFIHA